MFSDLAVWVKWSGHPGRDNYTSLSLCLFLCMFAHKHHKECVSGLHDPGARPSISVEESGGVHRCVATS